MITIKSLEEFNEIKENEDAVLFYFSHDACNVCKVLKPKLEELVREDFPQTKMYYVNIKLLPEISGQLRIFTVPTIIVCFQGREYIRKSRNIGIGELANDMSRPYSMLFNE